MRSLFGLLPAGLLLAGGLSLSVVASATTDTPAPRPPPSVEASGQPSGCPAIQPTTAETAPVQPDPRNLLGEPERAAALEAVQLALSEVGDGATYVWHSRNGRISGLVTPTQSFKDSRGTVCRHLVMAVSAGSYSRRIEGLACRLATGVWQLEG